MNENQSISCDEDDEIMFAGENSEELLQEKLKPWKVMIVDDDEDIHFLTKLVLRDFSLEGKELSFISAYSGAEAREVIKANPDTALIILDVIMEDMHAGLDVVKYIREELKNDFVRLILRTGQPGQEPEHKVVIKYDIDDFKTKTELSSQKLFTSVISALRSYRNLKLIEKFHISSDLILESMEESSFKNNRTELIKGILLHLAALVNFESSSAFIRRNLKTQSYTIVAATGKYENFTGKYADSCLAAETIDVLEKAIKESKDHKGEGIYVEGEVSFNERAGNFLKISNSFIKNESSLICLHQRENEDFFLILTDTGSPAKTKTELIFRFAGVLSGIILNKHR